MKQIVKLFSNPHSIPVLIVVLFALLASKGLIGQGYFNMHDDLQMMRQLEMEKCFLDGQIPCRWIPDMGYGYGYPLFNFYPPLPYLVGQLIRVLGYSFVDTVKMVFILSFIVSGISMYLLAKEFFGRAGGVISAIFYIWAPYHAVDIYVRGAMNESWALMWFPLIFWSAYRLIYEKDSNLKWIITLALSWFALFTSHNLMVLISAPFFAVWCLIWLYISKNWRSVLPLIVSGAWSFGLAAFFTLPVFLEKNIVQTNTLVVGYYEYTAHFSSISQILFSRFWGYGPSVWMEADDKMSFQIGWVHWILSIVVFGFSLLRIIRTKKIENWVLVILFFFTLGWLTAFMTHSRSAFIWNRINELKFVQFPWRFLTLVIVSFSLLAGAVTKIFGKTFGIIIGSLAVLLAVIYSWNYFVPEHGKLGPLTDQQKFSGAAWELQQTAGIYDYLPNTAKTAPKAPRINFAEILEGEGEITEISEGTNWAKFKLNVESDAVIRVNIMDFPEWKVFINKMQIETYVPESEEWGRIYFKVTKGEHSVYMKLYDTPVRSLGNIISVASWLLLAGIIIKNRKKITSSVKNKK